MPAPSQRILVFVGDVYDVRVYGQALDAAAIKDLMTK